MNIKNKIIQLWTHQLWPVSLFKDCSQGKAIQRFNAYKNNQENISLLEIPILNWIILCLFSFYGIYLSELLQKTVAHGFVYSAAVSGITFVFSLIGLLILSISYMFLKNVEIKIIFNH